MFGKGRLMREGAQAQGRITESGGAIAFANGGGGYHVTLRVEFGDGTSTEIRRKVHHGLGVYDVGETLPVRYDPADRTKIELDEPALKAIKEDVKAQVEAIRQEKAARPIPVGGEPGMNKVRATANALEQMSQVEGRRRRGEISDADAEIELEAIRAEGRKYN